MRKSRSILVTGATGRQGGSVARRLLKRGHRVRALTRRPKSADARQLRRLGAEIVAGSFDDSLSLELAMRDVDAVFAMTTPFEAGSEPCWEAEQFQGYTLIDVAATLGVPHVVYSSIASATRPNGSIHFESKYRIEQHLRTSGVPFTILAPVFFMENLLTPWWLPDLVRGQLAHPLAPERKLQQIAVEDIASFAVKVIEHKDAFLHKRIELASDELSGQQAANLLSKVSHDAICYTQIPMQQVRAVSHYQADIFEWLNDEGFRVDIAALHREHRDIAWHSFEEWAVTRNWDFLRAEQASAACLYNPPSL